MNTQLITITTSPTSTPTDLPQLAQQINQAITAAETHARQAVMSALRAGELLAQAKEQVLPGDWESWVSNNTRIALRTAQAYMRLHKKIGELPAHEAQRVALLPLRLAMVAIATPPKREASFRAVNFVDANKRRSLLTDASQSLRALGFTLEGRKSLPKKRIEVAREKLQAVLRELDQMLEAAR
jgi:hypothetical protein